MTPQALPDRETLLRWATESEWEVEGGYPVQVRSALGDFLRSDALWSALEVARAVAWCEEQDVEIRRLPAMVNPTTTLEENWFVATKKQQSGYLASLPEAVAALKAKLTEEK